MSVVEPSLERLMLDDGFRGVPPGTVGLAVEKVAALKWQPADGEMTLPLLSLDLSTFKANGAAMIGIATRFDAAIAPHAKTPMSPTLAKELLGGGAWATSVADIRQASVMLKNGIRRLLIANEIGGAHAARRLSALLANYTDAEVYLFVDSEVLLGALNDVWSKTANLPRLRILLEVGCGRGGVTSHAAFQKLLAKALTLNSALVLSGVACYEGTANRPNEEETFKLIDELFGRTSQALASLRESLGSERKLILSAGGSSFFDLVLAKLGPVAQTDGNTTLLLRSGACFFSDNGPIKKRLVAIANRGLLGAVVSEQIQSAFQPALRLWAEVLSHSNDGMAICGLGLRDASHDQGLPVPLRQWRNGVVLSDLSAIAQITKLNDQHAFLKHDALDMQIGDVVEFGIQHPCTCLDKHQLIFILNEAGYVSDAYKTYFG